VSFDTNACAAVALVDREEGSREVACRDGRLDAIATSQNFVRVWSLAPRAFARVGSYKVGDDANGNRRPPRHVAIGLRVATV
jgi:hypothetical protein